MGFKAERLYQKRVKERLFDYSIFDMNKQYYTLNIGYPDIHRHFCYKGCSGLNNELLDSTVLPADFGQFIFWEEQKQPVNLRYGFWGKKLWFFGRGDLQKVRPRGISDTIMDIRQWMYSGVKMYPSVSSIYMDDQFIIFNLDERVFNVNREFILRHFDEE